MRRRIDLFGVITVLVVVGLIATIAVQVTAT